MLGQLKESRSFGRDGKAQQDEGEVICSCCNVFLIHADPKSYFKSFLILRPTILNPIFLYSSCAVMLSPNTCSATDSAPMDLSVSSIAVRDCFPNPLPRNSSSITKSKMKAF